ncbi:MAG: aldo/keto reductase [Clostridia bacterium]|nr:aldo/keto reductase [Clostridia bacterium]
MRYIDILPGKKPVAQVALGCMRIREMNDAEADRYLATVTELGYNYFDHADIYGGGKCEEVFGAALARNPALRDKITVQTKCGICHGMYDFSREHILSSVDGSLKRLGVEKIDVLLLHRPDLLMDPDEVAAAFDELEKSGKVAAFGVSNHSPAQIELLKKSVRQPLIINQMQMSVAYAPMVASGANVNLRNEDGVNRDGYLRDYCRLHGITVQPWSPLQYGFMEGPFLGNEKFARLNETINEMAEKYGITDTGVAIAWLLRLPEKMQPVVGSVNLTRLADIARAADVTLSREDWYKIYLAAGYTLP